MKLHRELGITRKSAWHLARLPTGFAGPGGLLTGPVEVDEIHIGGKERNKHASRELNAGRAHGQGPAAGVRAQRGPYQRY